MAVERCMLVLFERRTCRGEMIADTLRIQVELGTEFDRKKLRAFHPSLSIRDGTRGLAGRPEPP